MASLKNTTALEKGCWVGSHGTSTPHARSDPGQDEKGKPTEKLNVPEFDGEGGSDAEVGREARSYIRRVQVWLRCTKLPPRQQALALYTALKGKAWIYAEELSVDQLASERGMDYYMEWLQTRFMEAEVSKVSHVMSELFRRCKRKPEQSVRDFNVEFERLVLRLHELHCELPALVKAWLYVDKLKLSENEEVSLLASVNNEYDVRRLQQAALIQDRGLRRPGQHQEAATTKPGWKRWGKQSVHVTAHGAGEETSDDEARPEHEAHPSDDDLVDEEVAAQCHSAYLAYQSAKDRYREAVRGRGVDQDAVRQRNEQRLKEAKARSYCSACKRRGHWHKDAECPLRGKVQPTQRAEHDKPQQAQMCNHVFMTSWGRASTWEDDVPDHDGEIAKDLFQDTADYQDELPDDIPQDSPGGAIIVPTGYQNELPDDIPQDRPDVTTTGFKAKLVFMMANGGREGGGWTPSSGMNAIVDTACTRTVAGHDWYENYCLLLDRAGKAPDIVEAVDHFKFGASRVHVSKFSVNAWFSTQGKAYVVNVAVVPCRVPLLFSRPVLASLGACYDIGAQKMSLTKLGLYDVPLLTGDTGHPVIPVDQFCEGSIPDVAVPTFEDAWIPAQTEYKDVLAASASPASPSPNPTAKSSIFYPKKLDPTIMSMVSGEWDLGGHTFFTWWRGAKQSRDFWVETERELVRVHVVPRKHPFNPSLWATKYTHLKDALLNELSATRCTDAVPCLSEGVVLKQFQDAWEQQEDLKRELGCGLWVGRSRFPKRPPRSTQFDNKPAAALDGPTRAALTMEDEEGRDPGGARRLQRVGSSPLDGAGAQGHPDRAAAAAWHTEGGGAGPHAGHLQDDAGGADLRSPEAEYHSAVEADEGGP